MNINNAATNSNLTSHQQDPASFTDKSDDPNESLPGTPEDADKMNFDDALDDDNENPVSQTLIDAAENTGASDKDDNDELDGEADEDGGKS